VTRVATEAGGEEGKCVERKRRRAKEKGEWPGGGEGKGKLADEVHMEWGEGWKKKLNLRVIFEKKHGEKISDRELPLEGRREEMCNLYSFGKGREKRRSFYTAKTN